MRVQWIAYGELYRRLRAATTPSEAVVNELFQTQWDISRVLAMPPDEPLWSPQFPGPWLPPRACRACADHRKDFCDNPGCPNYREGAEEANKADALRRLLCHQHYLMHTLWMQRFEPNIAEDSLFDDVQSNWSPSDTTSSSSSPDAQNPIWVATRLRADNGSQ